MNSMHGCAEASETDRGYLHSMGPVDGHSTMAYGLARGHVFGVVGNTDHHSGFPGSTGTDGWRSTPVPMTATFWTAMQDRRTNALTGDRIHLLAEIDGSIQGSSIAPCAEATLTIEAVAGGAIDCIDVIRNGRLCHRISPAITPAPIGDTPTKTLIHLEMGWGARNSRHDWTGDISIQGGDILAVEPRFRGPEIVSPLEGCDSGARSRRSAWTPAMSASVTAEANPNNTTPATQGVMIRARLDAGATIRAVLCGQAIRNPGAAFRGRQKRQSRPHRQPRLAVSPIAPTGDWQWQGSAAPWPAGTRATRSICACGKSAGRWPGPHRFSCGEATRPRTSKHQTGRRQ
jgi:hypothetical protein